MNQTFFLRYNLEALGPQHPLFVVQTTKTRRSFERKRKNETPCNIMCGTIKIPPRSKVIIVEQGS